MNVEYTGRQYEITPVIRKQVEHGLFNLTKILGNNFKTHVILTMEKHRCIAEITITARNHPIVGLAEATDMTVAVGEALERIERQAVKHKSRWRAIKRQPRKKWTAEAQVEEIKLAVGINATTAVPVVVHKYPLVSRTTEAHLVRSSDAVALRPLTLEEFMLGLHGVPRRTYHYMPQFQMWHRQSTIGSYLIGLGFLIMAVYLIHSLFHGRRAPANPWGSGSLEWQCTSPPPPHNFEKTPIYGDPYDYSDLVYDKTIRGYVRRREPTAPPKDASELKSL